jgi:hypothetical protein
MDVSFFTLLLPSVVVWKALHQSCQQEFSRQVHVCARFVYIRENFLIAHSPVV